MHPVAILWLSNDLRLDDNPALLAASAAAHQVIPLYINDVAGEGPWPEGAASRWWRHHSLAALAEALARCGSRLVVRQGEALAVLQAVIAESGATAIFWSRRYEPAIMARDTLIKQQLRQQGLEVASFNANLLFEPWLCGKADGSPYRVFTPFWRMLQQRGLPATAEAAPDRLPPCPAAIDSLPLAALGLLPRLPWSAGLAAAWQPGEAAAQARLQQFLATAIDGYLSQRDLPAEAGSARLSPHLHFGEISPRRLVASVLAAIDSQPAIAASAEGWLRQLGWREFAHHLLYHAPGSDIEPLNRRFAAFPWQPDAALLAAWQRGETGIPLVDAGMRELWQSGWMHNRVRMVVASLLCKNLLQPWQEGAAWFWDTLVDADLANNSMGWQWVAGSGADAAPYYRIFNPLSQAERFDPAAAYLRRWLPELAHLDDREIMQPWRVAGRLNYPPPIVDLAASRQRALAAYSVVSGH
jgi:deoxyribodipyrimidine photo-lyase